MLAPGSTRSHKPSDRDVSSVFHRLHLFHSCLLAKNMGFIWISPVCLKDMWIQWCLLITTTICKCKPLLKCFYGECAAEWPLYCSYSLRRSISCVVSKQSICRRPRVCKAKIVISTNMSKQQICTMILTIYHVDFTNTYSLFSQMWGVKLTSLIFPCYICGN